MLPTEWATRLRTHLYDTGDADGVVLVTQRETNVALHERLVAYATSPVFALRRKYTQYLGVFEHAVKKRQAQLVFSLLGMRSLIPID